MKEYHDKIYNLFSSFLKRMKPARIYRQQRELDKLESAEKRTLQEERRYRTLSNHKGLFTSEELRAYHQALTQHINKKIKRQKDKFESKKEELEDIIEELETKVTEVATLENETDPYYIARKIGNEMLTRMEAQHGEEVAEKIRPILEEISHLYEYGHL